MITLDDALNDLSVFDILNERHNFLMRASIQRALRNLDDAIKGKEYARDAVFTALGYIQKELMLAIRDENAANE